MLLFFLFCFVLIIQVCLSGHVFPPVRTAAFYLLEGSGRLGGIVTSGGRISPILKSTVTAPTRGLMCILWGWVNGSDNRGLPEQRRGDRRSLPLSPPAQGPADSHFRVGLQGLEVAFCSPDLPESSFMSCSSPCIRQKALTPPPPTLGRAGWGEGLPHQGSPG